MSPIRRKGRFVSLDIDSRRTICSDNFGGVARKIMSVNKEGVRMIAAKEATCDDFSTSLSASSSNTDQEADKSIFSDAQDDRNDGVCLIL